MHTVMTRLSGATTVTFVQAATPLTAARPQCRTPGSSRWGVHTSRSIAVCVCAAIMPFAGRNAFDGYTPSVPQCGPQL